MKEKKVNGDGNCLFRCLSYVAYGSADFYAEILHKIIEELNQPEYQENLFDFYDHLSTEEKKLIEERNIARILLYLSQDGRYGGYNELLAASSLPIYKRFCFQVVEKSQGVIVNKFGLGDNKIILLHSGNHFNLAAPATNLKNFMAKLDQIHKTVILDVQTDNFECLQYFTGKKSWLNNFVVEALIVQIIKKKFFTVLKQKIFFYSSNSRILNRNYHPNNSKIIIIPYCNDWHWTLIVIDLEKWHLYILDPYCDQNITGRFTTFFGNLQHQKCKRVYNKNNCKNQPTHG